MEYENDSPTIFENSQNPFDLDICLGTSYVFSNPSLWEGKTRSQLANY